MHASLEGLRAHLHTIAPPARHGRLTLDGGTIDRALGGGLPLGALHSVEGQAIQAETGAAPACFLISLLRHIPGDAPLFWVAQSTDLYPPGLSALHFNPARLIHIRTIAEDETLAVTETLLRSGAAAAVVAEAGRIARLAGHRLQMAALSQGTTCFILRRFPWGHPHGRAPHTSDLTAAVTSWRITPAPSQPPSTTRRPLPGPPRLHCALLHARTAPPASWIVEQEDIPHASHPFRVVAGLADPQAAPQRLAV